MTHSMGVGALVAGALAAALSCSDSNEPGKCLWRSIDTIPLRW